MTPELQRLIDERDIVGVAARYCRAIDTKDWALLDEVFVADGTAELGSPSRLEGVEVIRSRIRGVLDRLDVSHHLIGNHEVEVNGDAATHRCYVHAQHVRHDAPGGPHYVVAGRYDDRMVRTSAGWRIAHRVLAVMWTEGNVDVLRPS